MSVVYESLPPEADLRAACATAGGLPWFWQAGNLADGGLVVAFKLEGVEVQIGYSDFATLEREIDEVVVRHNPDTPLHKLAEGLLKAEPLLDADRLRSLQAKVAVFPPALGRAMAQHFIGRVTPWRAIAQLLHRDAALWCRELQVEACYKLIGALAGLNGVYFTTFQFKRMTRFAAKLKRAPADFSSRIDALLQAETGGGVRCAACARRRGRRTARRAMVRPRPRGRARTPRRVCAGRRRLGAAKRLSVGRRSAPQAAASGAGRSPARRCRSSPSARRTASPG